MAGARQEMPPSGGYGRIQWERKLPKTRIPGWGYWVGFIGISGFFATLWKLDDRRRRLLNVEVNEARIAVAPLVLAEQQRAFLRQVRKNRDDENELMKDHPGWVTGTLYGEPVYHNINSRPIVMNNHEYFAHSSWWKMHDRVLEKRKH